MYGETFNGRHTAQHQLQWSQMEVRNEIQVVIDHLLSLFTITFP